ncbi:hypothetical protein F2Q70_00036716 [Brassica cretica]|uniref:Uncharacterized protein n=1 Tax=Brassica cretica TaxID=69181 RepID=A0A8S9JRM4_BRACR|nr:hypothetical protein F2Q70_00036716 [Brassica cretica]
MDYWRGTKPIETTKPITDPPHRSSTTDPPPPIVRLRSCLLRDRGMIQTHHRWKHTTIPLSLDSSDVVGIVAKLSKLSETLKDKKICCSYRNNERLVFHQIEVTDPVKKNDFYSGSQQENPLPELGSSQLPLFTGVKASKATSAKKPIEDKEAAAKFQAMCSIKEKDIALKEKT